MKSVARMVNVSSRYLRIIREVFVTASEIRSQPKNCLTSNGFEVVHEFLPQDTCSEYIALAQKYLHGYSYIVPAQFYENLANDSSKCFVHYRSEIKDVNKGMVQIINAQKLDSRISQLLTTVQKILEERTGEAIHPLGAIIQLDQPDTKTKRRLHTDGTEPGYKAFIYLTDVGSTKAGPYTVIPGSHRHILRKLINLFYVRWRTLNWRGEKLNCSDMFGDMLLFYNDEQSLPNLGNAGTMTLTNQLIVHRGGLNENPRWALILHFIPKAYWDGKPFSMWLREVEMSNNLVPETLRVSLP